MWRVLLSGIQNEAVCRVKGVAALTTFSYKKMYGRFVGTKKVAVITRWPYQRGKRKAGFHATPVRTTYHLLLLVFITTLTCEQAPGEPERSEGAWPRPDRFALRILLFRDRRIFFPSSLGACSQAITTLNLRPIVADHIITTECLAFSGCATCSYLFQIALEIICLFTYTNRPFNRCHSFPNFSFKQEKKKASPFDVSCEIL